MAINVKALVGQAFAIAGSLVPDALPLVTLRLGKTSVTDPVADTASVTWLLEQPINPVAYKAKSERDKAPLEANLKTFAVEMGKLPQGTDINQNGQIQDSEGTIWHIYKAEKDPALSLAIFHTRR